MYNKKYDDFVVSLMVQSKSELDFLDEQLEATDCYIPDILLFESIGLHFICLDSERRPTYISTGAIRFFEMNESDIAFAGSLLIAPLVELAARQPKPEGADVFDLSLHYPISLMEFLSLRTARGKTRPVAAIVQKLANAETVDGRIVDREFQTLIFFYDYGALEMVNAVLIQARKCRELYLESAIARIVSESKVGVVNKYATAKYATALSANQEAFDSDILSDESAMLGTDDRVQERAASLYSIDTVASGGYQGEAVDFVTVVNKAVEILDRVMLEAVSISVKYSTSCLVPISEEDFLQFLVFLFDRGCEFVGNAGKIVLSAELGQIAVSDSQESNSPESKMGGILSGGALNAVSVMSPRAASNAPEVSGMHLRLKVEATRFIYPHHSTDPLNVFINYYTMPNYFGKSSNSIDSNRGPLEASKVFFPSYLNTQLLLKPDGDRDNSCELKRDIVQMARQIHYFEHRVEEIRPLLDRNKLSIDVSSSGENQLAFSITCPILTVEQ